MNSLRRWSMSRRALWCVLPVALIAWQTPGFVASLYPPRTITFDFYQDWASARNFLNGEPIYADISLTVERYLGWPLPQDWPPWYWRVNTHPPASVLLTLPFAWLDYQKAFLAWSLFSLAALAGTIWILWRQGAIAVSSCGLLFLGAILFVWYPFREQITQGQINLVLLFMLTATWAAHRSGWCWTAGAVLAAATAVKLFPGLLFVYFVLRRQWTVAAAAAAALVVITVTSALVLGSTAYSVYIVDVLAESDQWLSHWYNMSLMAIWTKLFDPGAAGGAIIPLWRSPELARAGGLLSCAAVLAVLGWTIHRARTRSHLDAAFGLTVTAMLLVSPITWSQNLLLLILPVSLMWMQRSTSRSATGVLIVLVLTTFIPPYLVWRVLIPGGWPHGTVTPWQTITALAFQCYAVLALFALQLVWSRATPERHSSAGTDRGRRVPVASGITTA